MNKVTFMNNITRTVHKVGFQLKKHSPEILVTVGVVGTVASAVMACKATTKVSTIIEKTKKDVDIIHECIENEHLDEVYTKEDAKKDLAIVYAQTGVQFVKLYAPSVILGIASLSCILASNNILHKRNAALAAAYATVDNSFKAYRNRVIDRFGEELDRELKYNVKAKEIEEVVVNEDGTETTVKKTVNAVDPNDISDYARFYDDGCTGWTKNAEHNYYFVKQQQNWANELLKSRGHLFLNEVYDMLGIPRTQAGQIVGWVYDKDGAIGDNYVDFGLYNYDNERARSFVNGRERVILLDFNVDGNIWELMK